MSAGLVARSILARWTAWGLALALALMGAAALGPAQAGAQLPDHRWVLVQVGQDRQKLTVTGKVVPQNGALYVESARVQGRILAILKREGDLVQVGTPLFAINSPECFSVREELRAAQRQGLHELIEAVLRREAQLGLSVEEAQCLIRANYEGVLTRRNAEAGSAFNPGDALVSIVDVSRLAVELDIPERQLGQLRKGDMVGFYLASSPDQVHRVPVEGVIPAIDPATRTARARLAPIALPPGTTLDALVYGELDVGSDDSVLKVPSSALVFHRNRQFVVRKRRERVTVVPVVVMNETETTSAVRSVQGGELSDTDQVASKGVVFLFQKLIVENRP